ncbi:PREDICTED: uncharacterized protein LOC108789608 [Nanorana parkeri]|uniref:uncharacterized protein LOC108789608 n=1 Tax=Nanorana parkeri TaxID=125878 RepID=UPI000854F531|nr:PREDICTED: uncharacterized protein LOC108789608 [Nanorana parkeri]
MAKSIQKSLKVNLSPGLLCRLPSAMLLQVRVLVGCLVTELGAERWLGGTECHRLTWRVPSFQRRTVSVLTSRRAPPTGCGSSVKFTDLSERASSCSSIYKSFSASFSQLHSSLSSLCFKSEETFKNSSSIAVTVDDRRSPQASSEFGSSVLSPGLYSKSCCGNTDLYQASSYSVRKYSQPSDCSPIDKMWHDHFLNHWPVLPPISPQRALSESSSLGKTLRQSTVSEFSNSDQDAFDELEMLAPYTGSTQSLENAQSESSGDCSSDSDICKYTASLTIGLSDPEESLADLRLSLLDHAYDRNVDYHEEKSTTWDDNGVMHSQRKVKEFLALSTEEVMRHLLAALTHLQWTNLH